MKANKWHWDELKLNNSAEGVPLPIISDAAVATVSIGDGSLIPVIIVDAASRSDIVDMINAHKDLPPGDLRSVWAKSPDKETAIQLILIFEVPVRCVAVLEFDIVNQGYLVEQIVSGEGLYLQYGSAGDRLSSTIDHPRIFAQVPSQQFEEEWDCMWHKALEKDAKKNRGMSRHEAKRFGKEVIQEWRKFGRTKLVGE